MTRSRNIVVLLDGTSNEIKDNLTNVLKLYRMLDRSAGQIVWYQPGVGTFGLERSWGKASQGADALWGLMTGWGLDDNIMAAYRFLAERWRPGDRIWLFGFSRGAYTARAVAGMIDAIGLLHPEQVNLVPYALTAYKRVTSDHSFDSVRQFQRVLDGRRVPIHFLGLWDTVASMIVPRCDRYYLPSQEFLPFTRNNAAVECVRHACAIDERRRLFRVSPWDPGQVIQPDPFGPVLGQQDVKTVWFAGDHSDVGGGYPEAESGAAKHPLLWMTREAQSRGLHLYEPMVGHLALGEPLANGQRMYVAPNATGIIHDSMTSYWHLFEWIPKSAKWRQWPADASHSGFYLPRSEPRPIGDGAFLHRSVIDRLATAAYRPANLPASWQVADTLRVATHDQSGSVTSPASG
jgi:uncharacterized protein (DUF2235 family)